MKTLPGILFALFSMEYGQMIAAEPQAASAPAPATASATQHWYTLSVVAGEKSESFTGSSHLDPTQLGAEIARGTNPIVLTHLRDAGYFVNTTKFEWRVMPAIKALHIIPRSIAYYAVLPGDPMEKEAETKSATGTE